TTDFAFSCPAPLADYPEIILAHGAGGALTKSLIDKLFAPLLQNEFLDQMHDGAVLATNANRLAFTTDSYVVKPLFFPGGDIGSLAVYGTVNDLLMCGARPLHLSLGIIIEEGLPMKSLHRVAVSIATACKRTGVDVVTGDTKVVDRGKGDGLYINMSGIGALQTTQQIHANSIHPGDIIILSGDIGRHGVAVLSARDHLDFETDIRSDCAPLDEPVLALLDAGAEIHCMRDLTRGGLATALIELSDKCGHDMIIRERSISIAPGVRGASELLGLDPLYIANEGRFIIVAPDSAASKILDILKAFEVTRASAVIGAVSEGRGSVICETLLGQNRPLDLLTGEQLPRIC
ncbi:MAG: hydrogenase expression/formation protein HypE, partial [Pseudomonadota bacterium]